MATICSADCHVIEPFDLWSTRLPKALRERAPGYRYTNEHRIWIMDGVEYLKEPLAIEAREDGSLVPEDVELRLRELDQDGVWAETIFGNMGPNCLGIKDPQFAMACARAFNDYLAETFGPYSKRELGIAMVPIRDVPMAVAEIRRIKTLGLPGFALPIAPHAPYFLEEFEPIWATAAELGLPISFHVGTGYDVFDPNRGASFLPVQLDSAKPISNNARNAITTMMAGFGAREASHVVGTLIGAGVLHRYPNLRIVMVEAGAGWLAPYMEAMDFAWTAKTGADREEAGMPKSVDAEGGEGASLGSLFKRDDWPYDLLPSDFARRQVRVTFMDEPAPVKFRAFTGVQCLMWGSDFPHPEGTWPRSQSVTQKLFEGVPQAEKDAMLGGNLIELYGIDVPA